MQDVLSNRIHSSVQYWDRGVLGKKPVGGLPGAVDASGSEQSYFAVYL